MIKTKIKKSANSNFQKNTDEKGFALVVTIILSAVMLIVMTLATKEIVDESRNSVRLDNSLIAYYAAEAGIENALLSYRNDHDTKITAECKNVEDYSATVDCSKISDTVKNNPNGYYYKMSMTPQKIDANNTIKLYKDQVYEIPLSKEVTGDFSIEYSQRNASGGNIFRVEITAYLEDGTLIYKNLDGTGSDNNTTKGTIFNIKDSTQRKIVRVRAWYTDSTGSNGEDLPTTGDMPYVEVTLPSQSGVNPAIVQIDSVGYYGKVARKISMTLDKSSGNVLGVFDYVIYSDSPLLKQ